MNVVVTYNEISDFLQREFNARPLFAVVDDSTFEISYRPSSFLPAIGVKFRVEAIGNEAICLSYECGTAASLMISGAVAYLREKIPSGIEVNTSDRRVNICPKSFEPIARALEFVSIDDVSFEPAGVNLSLKIVG